MIVTVYNSETKEIIASVDTDGNGFTANDISVKVSEYEPLFQMIGNRLYMDEDKFIIRNVQA